MDSESSLFAMVLRPACAPATGGTSREDIGIWLKSWSLSGKSDSSSHTRSERALLRADSAVPVQFLEIPEGGYLRRCKFETLRLDQDNRSMKPRHAAALALAS